MCKSNISDYKYIFYNFATSLTKQYFVFFALVNLYPYTTHLRLQAKLTTDTQKKWRLLLDGLSHMQFAVTEQEHVVLNAQRLLPAQEEVQYIKVKQQHALIHLSVFNYLTNNNQFIC